MKKKILFGLGTLVVVAVLTINVKLNNSYSSTSNSLSSLVTKNEANAECVNMIGSPITGICILGVCTVYPKSIGCIYY